MAEQVKFKLKIYEKVVNRIIENAPYVGGTRKWRMIEMPYLMIMYKVFLNICHEVEPLSLFKKIGPNFSNSHEINSSPKGKQCNLKVRFWDGKEHTILAPSIKNNPTPKSGNISVKRHKIFHVLSLSGSCFCR